MGTTKISEFLFNIKGKVAKQHAEPIIEKNLYTILGFKDVEDLEHKTSKSVNKKIWQLFIDCFTKEIDYVATKQVVKNVVCNIAKSAQGNAFTEAESLILNEKQDNKKRERAIKKATSILKKINPEKAFNELSVIKKQAEDFLQTDFYKAQSKPLPGFATSGAQLFAETLKYIETLEKLSEVKKEDLTKSFLLNYISSLNKKYPKSQGKREDAIRILSSDELKNFYNKGVEEGILQPLVSYKECRNLYDKMSQTKDECIIKKEEHEKASKSITSIISDIKKCREAVLSCKNFQSSYIKEKAEHPFRGTSCQKMIDIYQERIAGYQEKIRQNLNQIRAILKDTPQDVEKFKEIINCVHEAEQYDEIFDSALICLSNIQNKLDIQPENPLTELRASQINVEIELTRLCEQNIRVSM
ncbi:hypothetical protein C1A_1144 [Wolbachia endosymbiont of Culex quinquefasciatus JHB]|uniref:Jg21629 protein n=2 Tax=cellular organisms TaxID=131567 RepID=A0A8S4QL85_9NEOP|nr:MULTISPECIES: hypothetical protein [Wolbachia]CAH2211153.1 jg21629 [Pararge aegeria aegeria]EEB55335.1 hypothetical protein C1A_1144 [Wolbachia endosymbiont of Culex quinquefasciatus JHB]MBS9531214.1 hypothetical protein [Wolbachia endosymbiont of Rhagoletis cerasi]PBQ29286.1 hypothetical protein BTO27_00480 [Wolbachia pipientis wAus]QEK90000.1 hypothetical protein CAI20_04925 [Wolbachia endosymbiont of Chrysomya megacephala]